MTDQDQTVYFASLDVFDPDGPGRMQQGQIYGGDTLLFVLAAEDARSALERLAGAVAEKGMSMTRLRAAGPVGTYAPDAFPVPVELDDMIADAQASGRICALPPVSFAPHEVEWTEISVGMAEVGRGPGDPGEYRQFAVRGPVALALAQLFAACDRDGVRLRSVDDLQDAALIYGGDEFGKGSVQDLVDKGLPSFTWGTRYPVETEEA